MPIKSNIEIKIIAKSKLIQRSHNTVQSILYKPIAKYFNVVFAS